MKLKSALITQAVQGGILVFTVVITAVVGITLASYMTLVKSQNIANMRSQAWNATVPVIEAGIEEALTHLNKNSENTLIMDGWQKSGDIYWVQRYMGGGTYYYVTISNYFGPGSLDPVVRSIGYVRQPVQVVSSSSILFATSSSSITANGFINRGVRIVAGRDAWTRKAMVADGQIDFNGNDFSSDSFDSSDPNYSTFGLYDPNKAKDNGDVATNSGLVNSINTGNSKIMGKVSTGPGGSIAVGVGGSVGSESWVTSGNTGIETGWSSDDMNVDFPDVDIPFTGGAITPGPGVVFGKPYTYLLGNGNYQLGSLNLSGIKEMLITGDAVLYIPGNILMSGSAAITIAPGASLKLYVGGNSAILGGNGMINATGKAENFTYYGLPSNTSLSMSGNAIFAGVIYAPEADLSLNGSGTTFNDFIGASVTKSVLLNGKFRFHYDEDLANSGPIRGYTVRSWDEMTPAEVSVLRNMAPKPSHNYDDNQGENPS